MLEKLFPQILLRFDDLHSSMNWRMWDKIERLLDDYDIQPIVAVIPKNEDKSLVFGEINLETDTRFYEMHIKGYEVSLHGFNHVYDSFDAGIFGLSKRSEFAGVNFDIQKTKLTEGIKIFEGFGVRPRCWVGPNHSYDNSTVQILNELGFQIISDGFHRIPYMLTENILLIPQQKWKMRANFPGIVTVCYHHNNWDESMFKKFAQDLQKNYRRIINVNKVISRYYNRKKQISDTMAESIDRYVILNTKEYLYKLIKR